VSKNEFFQQFLKSFPPPGPRRTEEQVINWGSALVRNHTPVRSSAPDPCGRGA